MKPAEFFIKNQKNFVRKKEVLKKSAYISYVCKKIKG